MASVMVFLSKFSNLSYCNEKMVKLSAMQNHIVCILFPCISLKEIA